MVIAVERACDCVVLLLLEVVLWAVLVVVWLYRGWKGLRMASDVEVVGAGCFEGVKVVSLGCEGRSCCGLAGGKKNPLRTPGN